MASLTRLLEIFFGLQFLVFGLNGFFAWFPVPEPPDAGKKILQALVELRYLMPLLKGLEIFGGALLVMGYFKALAILLLAPISVNIFAFHYFVGHRRDPLAWGILAVQGFLLVSQTSLLKVVFTP